MDASKELDVYIPQEAEVRVIPLNCLPNSVRKKMGLPLPDRKSLDSPDVIWICPAVMKKKGQGPASCRESCSVERLRIVSSTLQMSFISSNRTAWRLLENITSGAEPSRAGLLHQDSAPPGDQNALVIYQERIYLCIRRPSSTRGRPRPREPQPSPQPAGPSASTSPEQDPGSERRHQIHQAAGKTLKRKADSPVSAASPPTPQLLVPDGVEQNEEDEDAAGGSWSSARGSGRNSPERSWAVRQTLAVASSSSSLSREFDFKELENEEKIAQLKAKFLQDAAALDSLLF